MRSPRFRLPALFLLGVVIAGIVTAAITIRLFQDYTESQTVADLLTKPVPATGNDNRAAPAAGAGGFLGKLLGQK